MNDWKMYDFLMGFCNREREDTYSKKEQIIN